MSVGMSFNASNSDMVEDLQVSAQRDVRNLRAQITALSDSSADLILRGARNHYRWQDKPVSKDQIREIYDLTKMGPTSMNGCPARFVFVTSKPGKARLAKSLKPYNVPKMMEAPVTAIIAYDIEFWRSLPKLFPHEDRRHIYDGKPQLAETTAFRNGTLQAAYMIIAARALGYDVGAMSGFSNAIVDEEFFAGTPVVSNFLLNIGRADETALFQRLPRFDFQEICSFA